MRTGRCKSRASRYLIPLGRGWLVLRQLAASATIWLCLTENQRSQIGIKMLAMSTNIATLTLMEETQLWMDWALGDHIEEVGKHTKLFTAGWALRDAALMDLALRDRVRMKRFKPLSRHSRYRHMPFSRICRGVFCFLCLCAVTVNIPGIDSLYPILHGVLQQAGGVVGLYFILGFIGQALFRRRLAVVDATPTGDTILDREMQRRFLASRMQRLRAWLSFWLPSKMTGSETDPFNEIEQRLSDKDALITPSPDEAHPAGAAQAVLRVNEASETWQALCSHLKAVLLGTTLPDAQTVALLLLITLGDLNTFTKRPRTTAPVLTLFSPEEQASAYQHLTQMLLGDPLLAAQIGEPLYDTLLGLRDNRV